MSWLGIPYRVIRYIVHNTWALVTLGGGKHQWSEWRPTLMPGRIARHCRWCLEYESLNLAEFDTHDHHAQLQHLVDEWGALGTILEVARACDDPEAPLRAAAFRFMENDPSQFQRVRENIEQAWYTGQLRGAAVWNDMAEAAIAGMWPRSSPWTLRNPMETLGEVETPGETPLRSNASACICIPCPYVGPIQEHGDCCVGSGIIDYSHDCPRPEDREMAERQHGPRPQRMGGPVGVGSRSEFCGCPPNGWSPDCLLRAHREFAQ